jgi:hypothetical protein
MLVAAGEQFLASLAITHSTLPGAPLALPRSVTTIARLSLHTLRHA